MSMNVPFFFRQLAGGNSSSGGVLYSEIFDVTSFSNMDIELRVYTASADSGVSVVVEGSYDPTFDANSWSSVGASMEVTPSGGSGSATQAITGLPRFVRAKVTVPSGVFATILMQGVAREAS